jgi:LmbE family N-acetylglucosaminyl deacetylase
MILTQGDKGGHSYGNKECLASLEKVGIKKSNIVFGKFSDGFLTDNFKTVSFIEKVVNKFKITKVYTHYPDDRHQDHRNCSNAVSAAARKVPEILLFQGPSTRAFDPHYFVEVSRKNMDRKMSAVACYSTQIDKGTVSPAVQESLARYYGISNNAEYVEAFAINHLFKREGNV